MVEVDLLWGKGYFKFMYLSAYFGDCAGSEAMTSFNRLDAVGLSNILFLRIGGGEVDFSFTGSSEGESFS